MMPKHHLVLLIVMSTAHLSHAEEVSPFTDVEAAWSKAEQETNSAYKSHEEQSKKAWKAFQDRVKRTWSDGSVPEQKTNVVYGSNDFARAKIDYENGKLTIEALKNPGETEEVARQRAAKVLASIITENSSDPVAALSVDEITPAKTTASGLAVDLTSKLKPAEPEVAGDGVSRQSYRLTLNLVPNYVAKRAAKYRPLAEEWSKKFGLDPSLVMGIMRQESAFNPKARSWVGAIGLMQIYPPYAGREVIKTVQKMDQTPTDEFLYQPANNIVFGTTFLQILRDKYFSDIKDKDKQTYLMICGYNWSAGRLKKAIAKGRLQIRAPASEVFDRLQKITPTETQDYLRKVTQYTHDFQGK